VATPPPVEAPAAPAIEAVETAEDLDIDLPPEFTEVAPTPAAEVAATPSPTAPAVQVAPEQPVAAPPPVAPPAPPASSADPAADYTNLLQVLVASGDMSEEQANELRVENISTGKQIDKILEEKNVVSEEALTKAKATFNRIPFIKLADVGTYPEAINQLPEGSARHYQMVPFAYDKQEGTLSVAMKEPLDLTAIDFAQQKTGLRILAYYAMPSEVERAIAEYYSQTLSSEVSAALEQTSQVAESQIKKQDLSQLANETIRSAPITKIVETMVAFAMKARASDIHIEPLEDRTRIRYRIDGILNEKLILPKSVHDAVVSRIKILSGLKIDEKRLPQDGRFNFALDDQEVDLRVSTLPTIHGEKIVMRLLKKDLDVPTLDDLGLNGLALHNVEKAAKVPHGIVLITGPTGSGKTTTLYSLLHLINSPKVNIMTLEDPVEYQMPGINQVQINPQAGLTFASGLRSFLRQDPNIIMVGEIRDSETAELAIQAALTGHLVFSTLHTSSAAGALPRLMDMGAEPFLLASSMTCVMAQRVLRKINPGYIEEYVPEPAVIEDIKKVLGEKLAPWCKQKGKDPNKLTLFRPSANRPQNEPEYKGRVAIFEVMNITEAIGHLILERKPAPEMEKLALKDGMLFMKQDGYFKALDGITTIEEVLRVAQI
ncbi:MAG: type pilus assembly protein PilB, partial [Patescibacteria group bacterium]|nr:type pilus assembly protein PilB [Patescibacteria group bacterium]